MPTQSSQPEPGALHPGWITHTIAYLENAIFYCDDTAAAVALDHLADLADLSSDAALRGIAQNGQSLLSNGTAAGLTEVLEDLVALSPGARQASPGR